MLMFRRIVVLTALALFNGMVKDPTTIPSNVLMKGGLLYCRCPDVELVFVLVDDGALVLGGRRSTTCTTFPLTSKYKNYVTIHFIHDSTHCIPSIASHLVKLFHNKLFFAC